MKKSVFKRLVAFHSYFICNMLPLKSISLCYCFEKIKACKPQVQMLLFSTVFVWWVNKLKEEWFCKKSTNVEHCNFNVLMCDKKMYLYANDEQQLLICPVKELIFIPQGVGAKLNCYSPCISETGHCIWPEFDAKTTALEMTKLPDTICAGKIKWGIWWVKVHNCSQFIGIDAKSQKKVTNCL